MPFSLLCWSGWLEVCAVLLVNIYKNKVVFNLKKLGSLRFSKIKVVFYFQIFEVIFHCHKTEVNFQFPKDSGCHSFFKNWSCLPLMKLRLSVFLLFSNIWGHLPLSKTEVVLHFPKNWGRLPFFKNWGRFPLKKN